MDEVMPVDKNLLLDKVTVLPEELLHFEGKLLEKLLILRH